MREMKLTSKQPGSHRYKQATKEHLEIANRLDRNFNTKKADQIWCGDITYIWTGSKYSYLAAVLDLYKRRVIGWAMSSQPDADLVIKALEHALQQRGYPKTVMFHSDQGCQYSSLKFRQKLWSYSIEQSMSRKGNCWDNAVMERLFRSLKSEWIPSTGYHDLETAKKDIGKYLMDYYNWQRPHTYNKGLAPAEAEEKLKNVYGIT